MYMSWGSFQEFLNPTTSTHSWFAGAHRKADRLRGLAGASRAACSLPSRISGSEIKLLLFGVLLA